MDFEFSDDQVLLRETVRRFLADRAPVSPYVRAQIKIDPDRADDGWREFAALGVGDLPGMVDTCAVAEELGRALSPFPFASSMVAARGLATLRGDGALAADLASGTVIGAVAIWEPDQRFDWRAPRTTASSDSTLNGEKVRVRDARLADVILVTASVGDGLGVFAVERGAVGTVVESTPTVDGTRREATVRFADTPARRLGSDDAADGVAEILDRLTAAEVVDGVGAAERALELTVDYAKQRVQFGRPIGSFQAVQHLCADMVRAVELARAAGYYACWACDEADATERHRAATMAQAFAADELYAVGAAAIQVHGGLGFTWEHDAHLFYKRLLTLQQNFGGSRGALDELARLVL